MYHETGARYDAHVMETSVLLWVLAVGLILTGLAGTLVPILPGIPLMLLGMFIAAWIGHFARVGPITLSILSLLTVFAVALDLGAAALGARRVGASRQAVAGAALGTVVGMVFGIPGLILGPFVGAAAGEFLARNRRGREDAMAAVRIGTAAWIGYVIGTIGKIAVAFAMLGVFALAWFID